jgi:hypothetical protein
VTAPVVDAGDVMARGLARQLGAVKASYLAELEASFRALGWWGDGARDVWLGEALPLVAEAHALAGEVAAAVADAQLSLLDPGYDPPPFTPITGAALRGGVPPEAVYERPLAATWPAFGRGDSPEVAVRDGLSRLRQLVDMDVERAADFAAMERFANSNRTVGYRRVPTSGRVCALCLVASTQLYHKRQLKPIHPGCQCRPSPVLSMDAPAGQLDRRMLDAVHAEVQRVFGVSARDARRIDYRKILLVREHGEYGPTLTFSDHRFTGPNALEPLGGSSD